MAKITTLFFLAITVLVIYGKSESKEIKKEKITYFLQKYEIAEIVDIPVRSSIPKFGGGGESTKSFQVTAFGKTFIVDLAIFYPREDTQIDYVSKLINYTRTFLESELYLYQGYVRNVENSSAIGVFSGDKRFRGYLITDEIFCIEPYKPGSVIVYTFADVIFPGCSKRPESEGFDCSETRYFLPWAAHKESLTQRLHSYDLFYDAYLSFLQRLQAIRKEGKMDDEEKNPSTDKHDSSENEHHYKSERKDKNKSSVKHKSDSYSAKKDYDLHKKTNSGAKTKEPDTIKTTDLRENRKYGKHKSKKHELKAKKEEVDDDDDEDEDIIKKLDYGTNARKSDSMKTIDSRENIRNKKSEKNNTKPNEEDEEDDDDDEDEDDEDIDIKILRDDDRFNAPENNVAFQKHSIDVTQNLSNTSRLNVIDSRNFMNNAYNNMDASNIRKESVEVNEKHQKQILKRNKRFNMKSHTEPSKRDYAEALQCNVQVMIAPSLVERFDGDANLAIKDVFIQFDLLNKILLKLPLKSKGKNVRVRFHPVNIVIYGDEVYSPFPGDRAHLDFYTKATRPSASDLLKEGCLSIGVANQYLKSGEFFDGYTPEGNGGACSKKSNTLLVSHGNANTPAPMAIYFAALMRGLTRGIGALDKDKECEEGAYPNPLAVLRDYFLTDKIVPSSEYNIFTECNVKEIQKILNLRACFYHVSQPLCGNSILDPGEECDCGPVGVCPHLDRCCNTPNLYLDPEPSEVKKHKAHIGCTLIDGAKCSQIQPCCKGCEIDKDKTVCFSGPLDCDIATCDGKSASCPSGFEASNGMVCHTNETLTEPVVCKDGKCDQFLCSSFGLEPCSCAPGSDKDCLYCCMKDGKCQAAGSELKLIPKRNFYLPEGTECMGGSCLFGKCLIYNDVEGARMRMRLRETMNKPPIVPASSEGRNQIWPLCVIINSVFSLLVLFLFQN